MSAIWAITIKDIKIRLGDRAGLVLMFVVPLLVITIASFALSPLYSRSAGRLRLPLVDLDGAQLSMEVAQRLSSVPGLELERTYSPGGGDKPMDLTEARRRIRAGERFGALVIPAGATLSLSRGEEVSLVLLQDPADLATTALLHSIMHAVASGLSAEGAAAAMLLEARPTLGKEAAKDRARAALGSPRLQIKQESVIPQLKRHIDPFQQNVPGVAVTFALLMTISAGLSLIRERESGTMRRILLAPVSRSSVLIGSAKC